LEQAYQFIIRIFCGGISMKRCFTVALAISVLFGAAPVLAESQLAQNAGLTSEQAQGMSLNEIAAVKSNRGVSPQDQQTVVAQQTPGSNPELEAYGIEKYNADQSYSDRLAYGNREEVTSVAFQDTIDVSRHAKLIAAAHLTPEEANGMSLSQVQNLYLDREH
jgi:hypothetical protein